MWIYHILFIHSSLDRHLGCFHFLAVMNNAAMNICSQVLYGRVFSSLGFLARCGIAGSYGNSSIVASLLVDFQSSGGVDFDNFATTGCTWWYGRNYWGKYWLFEIGLLCVSFLISNWDDITSLYKKCSLGIEALFPCLFFTDGGAESTVFLVVASQ